MTEKTASPSPINSPRDEMNISVFEMPNDKPGYRKCSLPPGTIKRQELA